MTKNMLRGLDPPTIIAVFAFVGGLGFVFNLLLDPVKAKQTDLEKGQIRLETEFQKGQTRLEAKQTDLEKGQTRLEAKQTDLEKGQTRLESKIDLLLKEKK